MRKIYLLLGWLLAARAATTQPPARARKVVFVSADGIPAGVIAKANTPNIRQVLAAGTYLPAHVGGERGTYTQTPTISAPSYMTYTSTHNTHSSALH